MAPAAVRPSLQGPTRLPGFDPAAPVDEVPTIEDPGDFTLHRHAPAIDLAIVPEAAMPGTLQSPSAVDGDTIRRARCADHTVVIELKRHHGAHGPSAGGDLDRPRAHHVPLKRRI